MVQHVIHRVREAQAVMEETSCEWKLTTVDPDKKEASGDHMTCSLLPETVNWLRVKIAWKKSRVSAAAGSHIPMPGRIA